MVRSACQFDLEAYHDGEMDAQRAGGVAEHVRSCNECAAELASLRQMSALLRGGDDDDRAGFADMTAAEMRRLHRAVDQMLDRDAYAAPAPFPMLKALTAMAASLLIIGMAWMMEAPQGRAVQQAAPASSLLASAPSWERVAVTLRVDPPSLTEGRTGLASEEENRDTNMADWVLQNLEMPGGDRPL
jgi:anti-sigma factor RsiW